MLSLDADRPQRRAGHPQLRDIAALAQVADRAEDYLATPTSILPQQATVGARTFACGRVPQ